MMLEPPEVPLTDGVVLLRMRRLADLEAIATAGHDPETRRWLTDPPTEVETLRAGLDKGPEAWRTGRATPMIIAEAATDRPAGLINLQFKADDRTTVAYSVFPAYRGRGFAPRAVRLLAGWALNDLGLNEIRLEAEPENTASIKVAEKSGFTRISDQPEKVVFRRSLAE